MIINTMALHPLLLVIIKVILISKNQRLVLGWKWKYLRLLALKSFWNAVRVKVDVSRVVIARQFCSSNAISALFQRVLDWMSTAIQKPCFTNSAELDLTFENNKTFLMPLLSPFSLWIFTMGWRNKNIRLFRKPLWNMKFKLN